jgi:hypothetical protein
MSQTVIWPAGSDIGFVCENHRWTPIHVRIKT